MNSPRSLLTAFAIVLMAFASTVWAEKTPDLSKTKFKDIAKYLDLSAEQQAKIKPDVDRIQDIVKQAGRLPTGHRGWGGGGRAPVGSSGVMGRPNPQAGDMGGSGGGNTTEARAQRQEWQKEITNRIEEIKSFLTPAQIEKFKSVQVPNLMARE